MHSEFGFNSRESCGYSQQDRWLVLFEYSRRMATTAVVYPVDVPVPSPLAILWTIAAVYARINGNKSVSRPPPLYARVPVLGTSITILPKSRILPMCKEPPLVNPIDVTHCGMSIWLDSLQTIVSFRLLASQAHSSSRGCSTHSGSIHLGEMGENQRHVWEMHPRHYQKRIARLVTAVSSRLLQVAIRKSTSYISNCLCCVSVLPH